MGSGSATPLSQRPPTSGSESDWPSAGASIALTATAQLNTFRFALSFSPIPANLAQKVQGLHLVDTKEFLPDKLSLTRQLDDWVAPTDLLLSSHPSLRKVSLIQSGCHVFVMYVVVLAEAHPELVKSHMVYLALIILVARANGGDGWITYDSFFCHNVAEDPLVDWGKLDPSLYTATFATQSMGPGSIFPHLLASDQRPEDCTFRSRFKSGGVQAQPSTSHQG